MKIPVSLLGICLAACAARADVVRCAPMGRILIPDADVRIVPTVFYPGWIARSPYGG